MGAINLIAPLISSSMSIPITITITVAVSFLFKHGKCHYPIAGINLIAGISSSFIHTNVNNNYNNNNRSSWHPILNFEDFTRQCNALNQSDIITKANWAGRGKAGHKIWKCWSIPLTSNNAQLTRTGRQYPNWNKYCINDIDTKTNLGDWTDWHWLAGILAGTTTLEVEAAIFRLGPQFMTCFIILPTNSGVK